ncbi:MAG: caspase family protein [Treponema sp.]|nr:caspase family protein [Treponema sp.]
MYLKLIFRYASFCLLMLAILTPEIHAFENAPVYEADIYEGNQYDESSSVKVFPQVSGIVNTSAFSPCNRFVVSGHGDGAVKVWEAETGILFRSYYGHEQTAIKVAWSPDGKQIVSGSTDSTIKIWNADFSSDTQALFTLKHDQMVFSAAWSPDSRFIVSASEDKSVRIWDASNGREIRKLTGHTEAVISAEFSNDGRRIASSSHDKTIIIWDAQTGARLNNFTGHTNRVVSVSWSPDNRSVVSTGMDAQVRIWDVESGRSRNIGQGVFNGVVYGARFSPDGRQLVTGGGILYVFDFKRGIMIWDAASGREVRRFSDHSNTILSVQWSADGRRILASSGDTTTKIYEAGTGSCISTFSGKTDAIMAAALDREGKRLVSGSSSGKVNIWNAQTGVLERSLNHVGHIYSVAISPDGKIIAAGAGAQNNQLKIWNADTGVELYSLSYSPIAAHGNLNFVQGLAFHPNGVLLAAASSDKAIRIWDVTTGRQTASLSGHAVGVADLAFNRDGSVLVSCAQDLTARVWKLSGRNYRLHKTLNHQHYVQSVDVSPDGRFAVTGSLDGRVTYWNIETGQGTFWSMGALARAVSFSPDGRSIIAGVEASKTIHLWDTDASGAMIYKGNMKTLFGTINSINYSAGGKRIIAGVDDGSVRIYNAKNFREIAGFAYFSGEDKQFIAAGRGLTVEAENSMSQLDGEWLTITPDGFYRGSARGDRFINVLIDGNDLTSMDAYSDVFHKPNIVETRLRGLPDPERPRFSIQQAAQFRPPVINILSPQSGTTVTGNGTVNIQVSITDRNRPIEDIRILVNGVRLGDRELRAVTGTTGLTAQTGGLTVRGGHRNVQFTVPVTMMESGNNRIEVMAYNGVSWGYSGHIGSVNVNWEPPQGVNVPLPDMWILAVGVNRYDNAMTDRLPGMASLSYCGNDAKEIVRAFKAQEGHRYRTVHSYLVTDGEVEPTAENVRAGIRFLEGAGQRDVVLIFMAGHGINEDGQFYFLTKDAAMQNGKVNRAFAISDETLKSALNLPGRRLIFIDACQSGGMDMNQFMYSLRRTNAYMLSSSEGDKPSYESSQYRHGLFTYSIVRGLDGMARPRSDAQISVLQLSGYVRDAVMRLTEGRNFRYQQKPVQYSWGFSDFFIAR